MPAPLAFGLVGTLACAFAPTPPAESIPAPVATEPAAPAPVPLERCAGSAPDFAWPARGRVTSGFGRRNGRPHRGIDISSSRGIAVRAAAAGTVVFSDHKPGYGRTIILSHGGGFRTVYAHNQDNLVFHGARVAKGEVIADMGSTGKASGRHLHFEIRSGNRPIDPLPCLPPRGPG